MNLKNLTILITRPAPEGQKLCEYIKKASGNPIFLPTIDIVPVEEKSLVQQQIRELAHYDWLIFMSPQTVYQSIPMIKNLLKTFPANLKVAAPGESTAQLLKNHQIQNPLYPKEDWRSEGLLALPEFQNVKGKKIALLCGENGRTWLGEQLELRGAMVTRIEIFRRLLPKIDLVTYIDILPKIDIIVCTSNEISGNLKILFQSHWEQLQAKKVIVVSERMLQYTKELGFQKIILAKNASHDAIMSTLFQEKDRL